MCPCYISSSEHYGLETVHLLLEVLILSLMSVTSPHGSCPQTTSFYGSQIACVLRGHLKTFCC